MITKVPLNFYSQSWNKLPKSRFKKLTLLADWVSKMSGRGSRARHVHVMSLYLLTSRTSPLRASRERIHRQSGTSIKLLYTCTRLPMNPLSRKPNHFRLAVHNCRLRLPVSHSRIYWNRQTYRTISIFAKIYTETLKLSTHSHRCLFGGKKFQWCLNKRVAQF